MPTTTVTSGNAEQVLTELEHRTADSATLRLVIPDARSVFSHHTARWEKAAQHFRATNVEPDLSAPRWVLPEFGGSPVLRAVCAHRSAL